MVPQNGRRPDFIAGQVAIMETEDSRPSYLAFASAPADREFEFLIKRGQAANTAGALFDPNRARPVILKDIVGKGFPIDEHRRQDLIFIAMGTGLAPLRSALRHIFPARHEYGRLVVLYGARTAGDFCFVQEMATEWNGHGIELHRVISQPAADDWSGPTGYVQGQLDRMIPSLRQPVALVCGSKEMMEQTRERLLKMDFKPESILTNY
ncbi:MAG TPA: hypothetical protein VJ302_16140 [Blastocatellia bacterium]|nr:hypothetical protein [Blastocatellia bacterium]